MTELLNQPIVIDNGSGIIKAGFAGEEQPKYIEPSIIGFPKYSKVMINSLEHDNYIGKSAQEQRGLLRLHHPIKHGIVQDWGEMELIWQQVINKLKVNTEDHPLLLTESPLNPKRHREQCAQIFFETFNTPAMYLSIQAILALYSSGRTTGVVMDSGDGVTHVVPVYNGFSLPGSIKRMDIAGRDITEQLQLLLQKNGILLQTSAEKEIVREIKEKYCYISSYSMNEQVEEQSYRLPDGQVIRVGNERHRATEILFRPELIGSESVAIHSLIYDSIQKVDIDLRPSLYQSIVLSGGTTMIRGFGDRLITELKELTTKGTKIKIYAPPERKYSVWIGGSILAGLSTFKKMWVSKEEWEENPEIIHSKCL